MIDLTSIEEPEFIVDCGNASISLVNLVEYKKKEEYHLKYGLSAHGNCIGSQVLSAIFKRPFKGAGSVISGSWGHKAHQFYMESGSHVLDDVSGNEWLVIGHEQYIRIDDGSKIGRISPIDNLVFNTNRDEYETWDLKFTIKNIDYINHVERYYILQSNIYGYSLMLQWNLPYHPICRIIFTNKANWSKKIQFAWRASEGLYKKSLDNIRLVSFLKKNFNKINEEGFTKRYWKMYAEGINYFNRNKKPYRYMCYYCEHRDICMFMLDRKDLVEKDDWLFDKSEEVLRLEKTGFSFRNIH